MRTAKPLLGLIGLSASGDIGPYTVYTSRRKHIVWFLKAPPTKTPSRLQLHTRNAFRLAVRCWNWQQASVRQAWLQAARLAALSITGYSLYLHWLLKRDRANIATVERHSGITLL